MRGLLLVTAIACAQQPSVDEAMRLISEGRLPEAEAALQQLAVQSPQDADLRFRLGLLLVKSNQFDSAKRELETAVALQPGFVFAWLALGDLRLRQKDRPGALTAAALAQESAANSVPAWKALAKLRARLGDVEGETIALRSLLGLTPGELAPYERLAGLLIERRLSEDARGTAAAGIERFPGNAELLRLHGLALYGLGRKDEAIDAFLAAMDAAPALSGYSAAEPARSLSAGVSRSVRKRSAAA